MEYKRLSGYQCELLNKRLYIVSPFCNAIFNLDFARRSADIVCWLDNSDIFNANMNYTLTSSNDCLVAIPGLSDSISIFDSTNRELKTIKISPPGIETNEIFNPKYKFTLGFSFGECVYLIGGSYPAILKINVKNLECYYISDWVDDIEKRIPVNDTDMYFSNGFSLYNGYAYIPSSSSRCIVRLNLCTDRSEVYYNLPRDVDMIHGIVRHGNTFWVLVTGKSGTEILKWTEETGATRRVKIEEKTAKKIYWWNPIKYGNVIFLFQENGISIYKVDLDSLLVERINLMTLESEKILNATGRYYISYPVLYDGKLIFETLTDKRWFEYDIRTGRTDSFYVEINDSDYERRYWNSIYNNKISIPIIKESELSLESYINIVKSL